MLTYTGDTASLHYNADYSGDIIVVNRENCTEVTIPSSDMLRFAQNIMYWLLEERIEKVKS